MIKTPYGLFSALADRRQFMGGAAAAGSLAMLGAQPAFAAPKKGGTFKIGITEGSTTDSLDPALDGSAFITMLSSCYLSQLTEVDAHGKLQPLLAESFEANADASVWTFKLRKGVNWHNGKPVTADDVVATINHHRGEDSKSSMKAFANQVKDIKAADPHTVVLTLKAGNADYPFILSTGAFSIVPSENGKAQPTSGIGSGPYMLEKYDAGVIAKLKKNPNYFRTDVAHADNVDILLIADAAARSNALVSGAVDLIDKVDLKTVELLKRKPDIEVLDVPGTLHYSLPMNTGHGAFKNNDVRLALKYVVDRKEMLDKILFGYGTIGNDHPISPVNRYFNTDLAQRNQDIDKAKFHLKKAGVTDLEVELSTSDSIWPNAVDAMLLYSEQAKKAGINLKVKRVPSDGYWSSVWMKDPWSASYWSGRPTEDWMFSQGYADDSSWNETFWKHKRFNELLKAARSELDQDKRKGMYWEMQELVHNEGGAVIPLFANHVMAYNKKKIAHPDKVAGNWNLDGYKLIERWWAL